MSLDPEVYQAVVDYGIKLQKEEGKLLRFSTVVNMILRKALLGEAESRES